MLTIPRHCLFTQFGISPDQASIESGTKRSSVSSGGKARDKKEFLRRFIDSKVFTSHLEDWFEAISEKSGPETFDVPFELVELQKFDYALEGVSFQQLIRMPSAIYASTSDGIETTGFLAIEDFLHASVKGLWEAFWSEGEPLPFYVACLYKENMKFYQAERAISNGKLEGLCAAAILLKNAKHPHGKWGEVLELALLTPDIGALAVEGARLPSLSILGEALYFALRMMLSRSLNKSGFFQNPSPVFVLLVDSQYAGVLKVEGDLSKLKLNVNNVYESAKDWIKHHSNVSMSPIDRIWNKLGNANWGDIGALQVLFATYHSILQLAGTPKQSIEDLAADHSSRLQARRIERQLADTTVNGHDFFQYQQHRGSPEIIEVPDESNRREKFEPMKLEIGSILLLDDANYQKGFQISEIRSDGELTYFIALSVEDPGRSLFLYIGSHPSQVEPAWEDMDLWYLVQRQTKVLTIMKQKGLSSKYLPELVASGKIIHSTHSRRLNSSDDRNHPWWGTPVLVTSPVGEMVNDMVRNSFFGSDDAMKCCHDCLSALSTASPGIRHGDIRPENVICITSGVQHSYFVLIGWGHAVLEERDRPAMNLHFSSTYALQEGKLCSASDAESLVYMLYFCSGGELPELDSVEGALQWRERAWSRRLIQQKLGDISAVLKAFADYVDSLCGTPYPIDYDIWLRRLKRHIREDDHGKEIEISG
ncbi:Calcium and calcium/calmodulin-dependent serine/threonine-protein kinase [Bienertia sinuspersici]